MDTTQKSQNILSLCTGIRGLERGIERAMEGSGFSLNTVAYAEIEAFIITNLIAGMEAGVLDPAPIWPDLKTFPWAEFRGRVHGIVGGYPCQPFSVAGNRDGVNDPRHLWPFIADGIRAVRPLWCFFENVGGHLTLGYETVRGELQDLGYHVEEGIFSAEEVGAPHRRERMFILAVGNPESYDQWNDEFNGRYWEQQARGTGTKLAYTHSNGNTKGNGFGSVGFNSSENKREDWQRQRVWTEPSSECQKVGYSTSEGLQECRRTGFGELQKETRAGLHDRPEQPSEELAYSNDQRLQGWNSGELCKCSGECTARTSSAFEKYKERSSVHCWPARPGSDQYYWEEPRTTLSGLGCTINGYNFREDLLRAAGNGVVEQTAELAWKTLWDKHFNSHP